MLNCKFGYKFGLTNYYIAILGFSTDSKIFKLIMITWMIVEFQIKELVAYGMVIFFSNTFKLRLILFWKCSYRLVTPYASRNSPTFHNLGDSLFVLKVIFKKGCLLFCPTIPCNYAESTLLCPAGKTVAVGRVNSF